MSQTGSIVYESTFALMEKFSFSNPVGMCAESPLFAHTF